MQTFICSECFEFLAPPGSALLKPNFIEVGGQYEKYNIGDAKNFDELINQIQTNPMRDLFNVSETKLIGYLPLIFIQARGYSEDDIIYFAKEKNLEYCPIFYRGLVFCVVYNPVALKKLIEKKIEILANSKIPLDVASFVEYISFNEIKDEGAEGVIKLAFNDISLIEEYIPKFVEEYFALTPNFDEISFEIKAIKDLFHRYAIADYNVVEGIFEKLMKPNPDKNEKMIKVFNLILFSMKMYKNVTSLYAYKLNDYMEKQMIELGSEKKFKDAVKKDSLELYLAELTSLSTDHPFIDGWRDVIFDEHLLKLLPEKDVARIKEMIMKVVNSLNDDSNRQELLLELIRNIRRIENEDRERLYTRKNYFDYFYILDIVVRKWISHFHLSKERSREILKNDVGELLALKNLDSDILELLRKLNLIEVWDKDADVLAEDRLTQDTESYRNMIGNEIASQKAQKIFELPNLKQKSFRLFDLIRSSL
ncbi:MAG: hypothetical protein ABII27_08990 [bacterium]